MSVERISDAVVDRNVYMVYYWFFVSVQKNGYKNCVASIASTTLVGRTIGKSKPLRTDIGKRKRSDRGINEEIKIKSKHPHFNYRSCRSDCDTRPSRWPACSRRSTSPGRRSTAGAPVRAHKRRPTAAACDLTGGGGTKMRSIVLQRC
jgi:hypothetical protein